MQLTKMTYSCTENLFALKIPRYSTLVSCFASYICNLQVNETNPVENPLKWRFEMQIISHVQKIYLF